MGIFQGTADQIASKQYVKDEIKQSTQQNYNPESENAQSGKAVAEAISGCVQKVNGDGLHYRVYAATDNPYEQKVEMLTVDTVENADGQIPRRYNGKLQTIAPEHDFDCANKKYVDDLVGNIETLLGGI